MFLGDHELLRTSRAARVGAQVAGEQLRGREGVGARAVRVGNGDAVGRAAVGEAAPCAGKIPLGEQHRAETDVRAERHAIALPGVLGDQKGSVEPEVMCDHYAPGEQGGELFRDEVEGRGVHGLRGGYAVNALRAEVALRIDQRLPPAGTSPFGDTCTTASSTILSPLPGVSPVVSRSTTA
jgi:hypothetical protein